MFSSDISFRTTNFFWIRKLIQGQLLPRTRTVRISGTIWSEHGNLVQTRSPERYPSHLPRSYHSLNPPSPTTDSNRSTIRPELVLQTSLLKLEMQPSCFCKTKDHEQMKTVKSFCFTDSAWNFSFYNANLLFLDNHLMWGGRRLLLVIKGLRVATGRWAT